jgi:hypothetical protein
LAACALLMVMVVAVEVNPFGPVQATVQDPLGQITFTVNDAEPPAQTLWVGGAIVQEGGATVSTGIAVVALAAPGMPLPINTVPFAYCPMNCTEPAATSAGVIV